MSDDFKFMQFIFFLYARCLFGEFFWRFSALQCLTKQRKMSATLSQFQYACIVRLKTATSLATARNINEHFLSTTMDRHVLNSKTTPQAAHTVVGYGVKICGRSLFMTSPDHLELVFRSCDTKFCEWSIFCILRTLYNSFCSNYLV